MPIQINGIRPDRVKTATRECYAVYVKKGDEIMTCVWARRVPIEIVNPENGYATIKRISTTAEEDDTVVVKNNGYVYFEDNLEITCTPYNSTEYDFDRVKIEFVGTKNYTRYVSPCNFFIHETDLVDTTKVVFTPSFKTHVKSWHTVWTGTYSFPASRSYNNYQETRYVPEGYKSIEDESMTRLTGELHRIKGSSDTVVRTFTRAVGSQTISDNNVEQYLMVKPNYLVSKVRSAKILFTTYTYYWKITKIEQCY